MYTKEAEVLFVAALVCFVVCFIKMNYSLLFLIDTCNKPLCFCRKLSKIFKSVSFKSPMAHMMKGECCIAFFSLLCNV